MIRQFTLILVLLALLTPAFKTQAYALDEGHDTALEIEGVWARKTSRTVSGAVYLKIRNTSHDMEELLGVSTEMAKNAMIHQSMEVDGIMRMEHRMRVPIAPGETLSFEPGGYHIMMMGLAKPLVEGDTFSLTLHFKQAGDVPVIVEVMGLMGPQ